VLTGGGDGRERPESGRRRTGVAGGSTSRGGGALELLRRWEAVEYARLGAWMLVVTAACSGRTPSRRIGGGKPAASGGWPAGRQLGRRRRKARRDDGRDRAREARPRHK
jgi:hypothetical protein